MTELIMSLACWRFSSLFVNEHGPFDVFDKIRHFLGVKYNEESKPYGTSFFSKLFSCVWCLSVWVGLFLAGVYFISNDLAFWMSLPFALSAVAVIIEETIDGKG